MSILKILASISVFISFYVLLEIVHRRIPISSSITRKIAHIASGCGALALLYFLNTEEFFAVLIFFSLFFGVALLIQLFPSIHSQERKTYGEFFYPIGILVPLLVTHGDHFITSSAILVLAISDPMAELIGRQYDPKHKTFQGSLVFFISTNVILLCTTLAYARGLSINELGKIILLALFTTMLERFSTYGFDNITIPASIGIGLYLFF